MASSSILFLLLDIKIVVVVGDVSQWIGRITYGFHGGFLAGEVGRNAWRNLLVGGGQARRWGFVAETGTVDSPVTHGLSTF